MLKVAVVTHYFPTSTSPWQGHSAYQTLRLLAGICDVHVFCSVVTYPKLLTPKGKGKGPDLNWKPAEVPVTYVPYLAVPVLSRALNGYTIARALLPHVRRFAPDMVLNYVIYPSGFAAVKIARAVQAPVVLTAIGSDLNRIADPLCGVMTRSTLREADFVTTVSHDLCLTARRMGAAPGKTRAKLNGCDTEVFFPRDRAQARRDLGVDQAAEVIVYVGRLDLRKGLMELTQSMAALRQAHPLAHCYIIGDGPAGAALRDSVRSLGLEEKISLVPSCLSERVALWMGVANLVVLPSYNEGCPNVVIEALSSGRPVVATRVGGIPELMHDSSGRMVPAQDVPALTEALDDVLLRTWDADAISRTHSRSWKNVADDLLEIFEDLLGRR